MNQHNLILKVIKYPHTEAGRIQGLSSTFLYILKNFQGLIEFLFSNSWTLRTFKFCTNRNYCAFH